MQSWIYIEIQELNLHIFEIIWKIIDLDLQIFDIISTIIDLNLQIFDLEIQIKGLDSNFWFSK